MKTIEEFAAVLRDPDARVVIDDFYPRFNPRGYRATVECRKLRYWYSVSSTLKEVSPADVAKAITSSDRFVKREKPYNDGCGFEATIKSGGRWYMLGHGDNRA